MSKWIPSWRYVPINYAHDMGTFENITQKCVMTNNLGGEKITIPANSRPYSDEVKLHVTPEDDFLVTMYFREMMHPRSVVTPTGSGAGGRSLSLSLCRGAL